MAEKQKLPPLRATATLKGELGGGLVRDKDTKTAGAKVRKEG